MFDLVEQQMTTTSKTMLVFRLGTVRRKRLKFVCFDCAAPSWRQGKFHDPIVVSVCDFGDDTCAICEKPLKDAKGQ